MLSRKKGRREDEDNNLREKQALSGEWVREAPAPIAKGPLMGAMGTSRPNSTPEDRGKGQPRLTTIFKPQEVDQPLQDKRLPQKGEWYSALARPRSPALPGPAPSSPAVTRRGR